MEVSIRIRGEYSLEWEKDLLIGSNYLNENLLEITKDGVSIKTHHWGADKKFGTQLSYKNDYFQVTYILNGKGTYQEGLTAGDVSNGSLILTPPNTTYQLSSQQGLEVVYVCFSLQSTSHPYIQKLFDSVKLEQLYLLPNKNRSAAILLWISLLKLAANDNTIYLKNNIDSLAITLFWSILKDFEKDVLSKSSKQVHSSASTLIYQAKVYIIENLAESITITDVANRLHLSGRHLSRLFNQELGQPFTTYIRKERIRKAGILLSDSDIPIKDIALQTGFSSVHYFTNVFSKEMDMPPGKFRERFRHQNLIT